VFPATSEREKIRFHLINRIKFLKIDAVTGEPVSDEDKMNGCGATTASQPGSSHSTAEQPTKADVPPCGAT
jgi:hypothetical protein